MRSLPTLLLASLLSIACQAPRTSASAALPGTLQEQAPAAEKTQDLSGTDPTLFLRTLKVSTEYIDLGDDDAAQITTATYIHPFAEGRMNLRVKAPLTSIDVGGAGETGMGDLSLRYNWLAHLQEEHGILLAADLTLDTATDPILGTGNTTLAPTVTWAYFLSATDIFAPTYQHVVSLDQDSGREELELGVIDLYYVRTALDKKSWWTIDPTVVLDYGSSDGPALSVEVERGWNVGTAAGGALNFYVRPGIGFGDERPYDWNLEIGITTVGF